MASDLPDFEPSDGLFEAIASFEEARDSGENPDPQEWLARYPGVAEGLKEYFADQENLGRLAEPIVTAVAQAHGLPEVPQCHIHKRVGTGGMAEVFQGQDIDFQRTVAV